MLDAAKWWQRSLPKWRHHHQRGIDLWLDWPTCIWALFRFQGWAKYIKLWLIFIVKQCIKLIDAALVQGAVLQLSKIAAIDLGRYGIRSAVVVLLPFGARTQHCALVCQARPCLPSMESWHQIPEFQLMLLGQ